MDINEAHTRKTSHGVCTFTPYPGADIEEVARSADIAAEWAELNIPPWVKLVRIRKKHIGPVAVIFIVIVGLRRTRLPRVQWDHGPAIVWCGRFVGLTVMMR